MQQRFGFFFTRAGARRWLSLGLILWAALVLTPVVSAEIIPTDRLVPWDPGVRGGIPAVPYRVDVKDYGATGDGTTNDGPAFNAAIQAAVAPGFVWVPAGNYRIATIIQMKSGIVLQGAGPDKSRLLFDLPAASYHGGIEFNGSKTNVDIAALSGYTFGSTTLQLASTAGMGPGTLLWLYQDNDEAVMFTADYWNVDYAADSMSQMVGVAAVNGNSVTLDAPLRLDYQMALNPRVQIVQPIQQAGVEGVYLERLDSADAYTISMTYAQNCWVRYVESRLSYRAHIWAFYSRWLTITTNYFYEAHDYGDGGHGYGVTLADSTSDVLVTNNIFRTLRHSMMVKEGANGNVFSYNYSTDNQLGKADGSFHGHYNYANLFEGNDMQQIIVSDWWGPSGKFSTLFRNRVHDTVGLRVEDHSNYTNIAGNTTPVITIQKGPDVIIGGYPVYMGEVEYEFVDGNLVAGVLEWSGAPDPLVLGNSYYLSGPPEFWGNKPWPAIGADVDAVPTPTTLPAQDRYTQIVAGQWHPPLPLILRQVGNGPQAVTLQLLNAKPRETVYFMGSPTGEGAGPCPPKLGGLCLDLLPPATLIGSARANSQGIASKTITPPANPYYVQAAIKRGQNGSASVKSNVTVISP